jgi:hypothetical protein
MTLAESFMKWRLKQTTVKEVEAAPILDHERAFTDSFTDWKKLKAQLQPGDELWIFRSPDEAWERFMGWQGLLIVRNGQLLDVCVSAQN